MHYRALTLAVLCGLGISTAQANLVDTGTVYPSNATLQQDYDGTMWVGYSGFDGTFEVNTSQTGNGFTSAAMTGLVIGHAGANGEVRVIGDGTSGSARIDIYNGYGLRNSVGGTGLLELRDGGVVESHEQDVYLGNQGLESTPGNATTNIDGAGSILRTQQGSEGQSWERDGGRIYVGFDGTSTSTVNITNGGLMEALSGGVGDDGDDGSFWIGTSADPGSTAVLNIDGVGSIARAENYIEVGGRSDRVDASVNISNGGTLAVSKTSTYGTELFISALAGNASVNVDGAGSTVSAETTQIGSRAAIAGFRADGSPTTDPDWDAFVEGEQITDLDGNPLFDTDGNPVVAELATFGDFSYLQPSTYNDNNRIYVRTIGNLLIDNQAAFNGQTIEVSTNDPAEPAYNDRVSTLTVRNGGVATADVTVNENGLLNGNGTIVGNVTVDGGTVAPGNSPGTLTVDGDLILLDGLLELEIGALAQDILDVSGNVEIGKDLIIQLLFDFEPVGYVFNLGDVFNVGGNLLVDPAFNLLNNLQVAGLTNSSSLTVTFGNEQREFGPSSAVPVPPALLLIGMGMLAGFTVRRVRSAHTL